MERIILVNEDENGYGYTILQRDLDSRIYVMYWAKDTQTKSVCYLNMKNMYDKCSLYINSDLKNISDLHRAKYIMCLAFMKYYDDFVQI